MADEGSVLSGQRMLASKPIYCFEVGFGTKEQAPAMSANAVSTMDQGTSTLICHCGTADNPTNTTPFCVAQGKQLQSHFDVWRLRRMHFWRQIGCGGFTSKRFQVECDRW